MSPGAQRALVPFSQKSNKRPYFPLYQNTCGPSRNDALFTQLREKAPEQGEFPHALYRVILPFCLCPVKTGGLGTGYS